MTGRQREPVRSEAAARADEGAAALRADPQTGAGPARSPADVARLEARDVAFSYAKGAPVLERVSAEITAGSFLAILGVNGSGKSTLMACLDDILTPERGVVTVDGMPIDQLTREERARRIAFVAQHSHAGRLTVYDALLLGRKPYARMAPGKADLDIVDEVIADMHMGDLALRYVDELSGGEYQKVVIARAFVQQTDVLLLDEPTNNLDMANQAEVMRLVRNAVDRRGIAAAAVMHDINLALRFCDRFLMIKGGEVAAFGDASVVTPAAIEHVYGVRADIIDHKGARIVVPLPEDGDLSCGGFPAVPVRSGSSEESEGEGA